MTNKNENEEKSTANQQLVTLGGECGGAFQICGKDKQFRGPLRPNWGRSRKGSRSSVVADRGKQKLGDGKLGALVELMVKRNDSKII